LFEKLISQHSTHGRNPCARPIALEQPFCTFGPSPCRGR
jgi:hypothetical protein